MALSHTDRRPVRDEDGVSEVENGSCAGFTKSNSQMALGKCFGKMPNINVLNQWVHWTGKLFIDEMNLQYCLQVDKHHPHMTLILKFKLINKMQLGPIPRYRSVSRNLGHLATWLL